MAVNLPPSRAYCCMKRIPMLRRARPWTPRETCDTLPKDWIHESCQVFPEEHTLSAIC